MARERALKGENEKRKSTMAASRGLLRFSIDHHHQAWRRRRAGMKKKPEEEMKKEGEESSEDEEMKWNETMGM